MQTFIKIRFFLCAMLLFSLSGGVATAQGKLSIALFNLTPISIESIGVDGDLLFSIRNELERSEVFQLMSRRDMEVELSRFDGAQVNDTGLVTQYGRSLGVNYVLTGTIDLERTAIVVNFKLVDIVNGVSASEWTETFDTKSELVSRAPEITNTLERNVRRAELVATESSESVDAEIITNFIAKASGDNVSLTWVTNPDTSPFYYNLYRGSSESGPFEFLSSATETRYMDTGIDVSGSYFYRIGVVLDTGKEVSGATLATVSISKNNTNRNLAPPTVLESTAYISGLEIQFVPAITNAQKMKGYQLYYRQANQSWNKALYLPDSGELSYRLKFSEPLAAGSQYEFALTGLTQGSQESPRSTSIFIETPSLPTLENSGVVLTRRVPLTWSPAVNTGVKIHRRIANSSNWSMVGQVTANTTEYVDTQGLGDGIDYEYALSLFDAQSESNKTPVIKASTKKLAAPSNFSVSSGVKRAVLNWTKVDDKDVKGYQIFRKQGDITSRDTLEQIAQVNDPALERFVDGQDNNVPLLDGTKYNYLVAAINRFDGPGEPSLTESATTKPRPGAASDIDLSIDGNAIKVNWLPSQATDVTQYAIERKWQSSDWVQIAVADATQSFYTDTDLRPYATTMYRVVAIDADGLRSNPTTEVSIQSPEVIDLRVAQDGQLRRVGLAWSVHKNINGYQLYRRKVGNSRWTKITQLDKNSTTHTDRDDKRMSDGVDYEYALSALSADGESPKSQPVVATTKYPPAPPESFKAESGLVKSVELNWIPSTDRDVAGYKIYRLDSKQKLDLIETLEQDSASRYVDEGSFFRKLDDGQNYTYVIRAFNPFDVEGQDSERMTAQTKAVPKQVNGLQVRESNYQVELTWSSNPEPDISFYQVYRGSSCSSVRAIATSRNTNYIDNDANDGRTYCYRISATDSTELEGIRSSGVSVDIPKKPE